MSAPCACADLQPPLSCLPLQVVWPSAAIASSSLEAACHWAHVVSHYLRHSAPPSAHLLCTQRTHTYMHARTHASAAPSAARSACARACIHAALGPCEALLGADTPLRARCRGGPTACSLAGPDHKPALRRNISRPVLTCLAGTSTLCTSSILVAAWAHPYPALHPSFSWRPAGQRTNQPFPFSPPSCRPSVCLLKVCSEPTPARPRCDLTATTATGSAHLVW